MFRLRRTLSVTIGIALDLVQIGIDLLGQALDVRLQ